MFDEDAETGLREELGRQQAGHVADGPAGEAVQVAETAEPRDGGHGVAGAGHQLQPRRGDNGQGALGAGQHRRIVVTGVVLDQPGQVRQHGAVGEHRLDAAQLGAHRPVAQHAQPARVGGHGAADGRGGPAGDDNAQVEVRVGVRDLLEGHARARGHLRRVPVHRGHLAEPGQAEDHLAVPRHAPSDQASVTALRHHREPGFGAQGQDGGDFRGVAGPHHRRRMATETSRPVHRESRRRVTREHVGWPHQRGQGAHERVRKRGTHPTMLETGADGRWAAAHPADRARQRAVASFPGQMEQTGDGEWRLSGEPSRLPLTSPCRRSSTPDLSHPRIRRPGRPAPVRAARRPRCRPRRRAATGWFPCSSSPRDAAR